MAGEQRLGTPQPLRVQLPHHRERFMTLLRLQSSQAQDQGFHVPIRRRHHLRVLLSGREHSLIAL